MIKQKTIYLSHAVYKQFFFYSKFMPTFVTEGLKNSIPLYLGFHLRKKIKLPWISCKLKGWI